MPSFLQRAGEVHDFFLDQVVLDLIALEDGVQDDARLVLGWVVEMNEDLASKHEVGAFMVFRSSTKQAKSCLEIFCKRIKLFLLFLILGLVCLLIIVQLDSVFFLILYFLVGKQSENRSVDCESCFVLLNFIAEKLHLVVNFLQYVLDLLGFPLMQVEVFLHLKLVRVLAWLVWVVVPVLRLEQHVLLPQLQKIFSQLSVFGVAHPRNEAASFDRDSKWQGCLFEILKSRVTFTHLVELDSVILFLFVF